MKPWLEIGIAAAWVVFSEVEELYIRSIPVSRDRITDEIMLLEKR